MNAEAVTHIDVLLLTDSKETARTLPALLGRKSSLKLRVEQMAFGEGVQAVLRRHPQVVVLADTLEPAPKTVEAIEAAAPHVPLVAVLPEGDMDGAQECSLAGARATLLKPLDGERLLQAVQQVHARELRRKQHVSAAATGRRQRACVVAVHGVKGGVGASTIASNLAAALRQLSRQRVALVDGDVLGGDVGVLLDLAPVRSLADWISSEMSSRLDLGPTRTISDLPAGARELDEELLESLLVKHHTGVQVLLAPEQYQHAEAIRGEDVKRILVGLRSHFDYVVVDTPSRICPVGLAALDEADRVVVTLTPEVSSLRAAARFLQLAGQLGYPAEKLQVVVNRANTSKDITVPVIEEQLRRDVTVALPSDGPAMLDCQNRGQLLVAANPRHKAAHLLQDLAQQIAVANGFDAPSELAGVKAEASGRAAAATVKGKAGRPALRLGSGTSTAAAAGRPAVVDKSWNLPTAGHYLAGLFRAGRVRGGAPAQAGFAA